jgi:hypothetical protein
MAYEAAKHTHSGNDQRLIGSRLERPKGRLRGLTP